MKFDENEPNREERTYSIKLPKLSNLPSMDHFDNSVRACRVGLQSILDKMEFHFRISLFKFPFYRISALN